MRLRFVAFLSLFWTVYAWSWIGGGSVTRADHAGSSGSRGCKRLPEGWG